MDGWMDACLVSHHTVLPVLLESLFPLLSFILPPLPPASSEKYVFIVNRQLIFSRSCLMTSLMVCVQWFYDGKTEKMNSDPEYPLTLSDPGTGELVSADIMLL